MLQSILSHTPLYVWAILGFLVYRGIAASSERTVEFKKVFIIPIVMFGLSLQGIQHSFSLHGMAPWVWLAGVLIATALVWKFADARAVTAQSQQGTITVRGSWLPLAMMMAIFCTKYVVAVSLAMHPQFAGELGFMTIVCGAYGLFSGVFLGKLLRTVQAYRQADATLAMA